MKIKNKNRTNNFNEKNNNKSQNIGFTFEAIIYQTVRGNEL